MFDAGVRDDNFVVMALANDSCNVAVKTPWGGSTERRKLKEIEMQGTVIAPLKCSVQIGDLGERSLEAEIGIKYKGCLSLPPLSYIDDVLTASNCGIDSIKMNAIVQEKISARHLKLGPTKCKKIHFGNKKVVCPEDKASDSIVEEVSEITYLGTILSSDGKADKDIELRHNKGICASNQIINMLNENFTYNYFEIAMTFRNSILVNGILSSLEASNFLSKDHIRKIEECDFYLMKNLFRSGSCSPILGYYWETGAIPLGFILMGRRANFYRDIFHKSDNEIVKAVINLQKQFPSKHDWYQLIVNDFSRLGIDINGTELKTYSKERFKNLIRQKLKIMTERFLLENKTSKLSNLENYNFQEYLSSSVLTLKQKRLLYQFRVRMIDNIKDNFKQMHLNDNLLCELCFSHYDDQPSLLQCPKILENRYLKAQIQTIKYTDIFENIDLQIPAIVVLEKIVNFRSKLLTQ